MKKLIVIFFIGVFFSGLAQDQFDIPDTPVKQTSLYDYIGLLTDSGARYLENKLIRYSDSTATQIVIIIIESTQGENINKLARNWGNKWGIGEKEKDNGIVLLMAKSDRKVAISTGKGIEGKLTNSIAKKIIESRIIPEFKKGNYYKGLNEGTDGIIECLSGNFKETKRKIGDFNDDNWWQGKILERILAFLFFAIAIIFFIVGKSRNGRRNDNDSDDNQYWDSDDDTDRNFYRDYDHSGGGSSSGGGFSGGFGGGSFGGGGASGSW